MKRPFNLKSISIFLVIIVAAIYFSGAFSVIGSDTETLPNTNNIGYDVKYLQPIEVGTYYTDQPILKIHSIIVEHEFDGASSALSRPSVQFMTADGTVIGGRTVYKYTNYPIIDIGLSAEGVTTASKGTNEIKIYAQIPSKSSSDNVATMYIDMELNDMVINYDPIECSSNIDCDDSRTDTIDTCFEYTCNYLDTDTYEQIKTDAQSEVTLMSIITTSINNFLLKLNLWISGLL